MAKKTAAGFSAYMQSDTIKITIDTGADRTTFGLSIALLKARSPYLARKIQAALTPLHNPDGSLFVERNDEVEVRLPRIGLAPFKQFIEWIHKQPLTAAVSNPTLLVATYLLAHKLEAVPMRNDILDTLCSHHSTKPTAPIGIYSMVTLLNLMSPDAAHNTSENLLLKFMVHQLTYKIFNHGWDAYKRNTAFETMVSKSIKVVYWHLDELHKMQKAACPTTSFEEVGVKPNPDGDGEDADGMGAERPHKRAKLQVKVKRSAKGAVIPNPAEKGGCTYHEHPNGAGDAKCFKAVDLTEDGVMASP